MVTSGAPHGHGHFSGLLRPLINPDPDLPLAARKTAEEPTLPEWPVLFAPFDFTLLLHYTSQIEAFVTLGMLTPNASGCLSH